MLAACGVMLVFNRNRFYRLVPDHRAGYRAGRDGPEVIFIFPTTKR